MRVGSNHHSARKGIVFQHHLMDNSSTWFPESNPIFVRYRLKEVKHLSRGVVGRFQIGSSTLFGLDQVIAMHSCWYSYFWFSCLHKLQQCHLSSCVLTCDSVWSKVNIIYSSLESLFCFTIPQMGIQNFFRCS